MAPVSAERDDLLPRAPDKRGPGLLLALLMHGLLIGGLALGLNWRSSEPEGVEAELWAAVPQAAAPAEPPPPPPPEREPEPVRQPEPPPPPPKQRVEPEPDREAEIAIEKEREKKRKEAREREEREEAERQEKLARERREKQEEEKRAKLEEEEKKREKLEQERKEQQRKRELADAERKKREEQDKRLQAQRDDRLKRLMSQAGTGSAEQGAPQGGAAAGSPSASYAGKIIARVRPNIVFSDVVAGNPSAEVEVRAAPDGTILGSRLIKSSGSDEWDQAVLRAVDKTQTLPRDENGRVPSPMILRFRPRDL
ncbi:cell envelope integrity protein TolA [Aquabacterium sp. A7-Y]|uniref:cell envelope integrity protein TolA n=1 Tax=Aquabacterium sp. A7-Y TaxID=1349605 RepID=UPI00223D2B49|nr:cell envelope integrity protein TolA [Aquabacterium sp. A7-Y]MCW7539160.1 cell envelope integrity protein TolA [Aquabacterium sp. A7-Y]